MSNSSILFKSSIIGCILTLLLFCVPVFRASIGSNVLSLDELRDLSQSSTLCNHLSRGSIEQGGVDNQTGNQTKVLFWVEANNLKSAENCINDIVRIRKKDLLDLYVSTGTSIYSIEYFQSHQFDKLNIMRLKKVNLLRYILLLLTISAFVFISILFLAKSG